MSGYLEELPAGFELAIGGGNPLDHPGLLPFLKICKQRGHIANMTINQLHLNQFEPLIRQLISNELINGLGLSIRADAAPIPDYLKQYPHLVYHLIIGIHSFEDLVAIREKHPNAKVLLLGYKSVGFGEFYKSFPKRSRDIEKKISRWKAQIPYILNMNGVISFDNLAIDQLQLQKWFEPAEWSELFMGEDGEFSMYVDAVTKTFAISSTNPDKLKVENKTITECFKSICRENLDTLNVCS